MEPLDGLNIFHNKLLVGILQSTPVSIVSRTAAE